MTVKPAALFVSLDGLLEPLGQSQVLAYLEVLAADYTVYLISFEKAKDAKSTALQAALKERMAGRDIVWHPLAYMPAKTIVGAPLNILRGAFMALCLMRKYRITLGHARSYLPMLMLLPCKWFLGAKLLFDIRGFWPDERVDSGVWKKDGIIYRGVKWLEKHLFGAADSVVTLTQASVEIIQTQTHAPVTVIPTCADLARFCPQPKTPDAPFIFGHVGNVSGWYLFDETLQCFIRIKAKRPDAQLHIINKGAHGFVRARIAAYGVSETDVVLREASHSEMPALIAQMSAGAAVIKPIFSKLASAPTKMAEYLGCGIPMLGNAGVGDVASILEGEHVGAALHDFTDAERDRCAAEILALCEQPDIAPRCAAAAQKYFSLGRGAACYRDIYQALLQTELDRMGS